MEPKIGIIVCGFDGDRQFIPNPYIQSVRYSKGCRSSSPSCAATGFSANIYNSATAFFSAAVRTLPRSCPENPPPLVWRYRCHGRSVPYPAYETDPPYPQTGPGHQPRHAGAECSLRRNHLAGSLAGARENPQPYAGNFITGKAGHRVRTERGSLIRQCFGRSSRSTVFIIRP